MKKLNLILTLFFFGYSLSNAQEITAKFIDQQINIDGVDSEKVWEYSNSSSDFWQWRPNDDVKALKQTEFKALFDKENIYLFVKAYTKDKRFTVYNLKRDFEIDALASLGLCIRFYIKSLKRLSKSCPG